MRWIVSGLLIASLIAVPLVVVAHARITRSSGVWETQSRAFLPVRDLPRMTKFQDITFTYSPFGDFAVDMSAPVIVDFRGARLVDYIANVALHGRYRLENDRYWRSRGYSIGKWPQVPLSGSIVVDSTGKSLEWYENNTSYRTTAAARMHLRILRGSGSGIYRERAFPLRLGDAAYAYAATPIESPDHPQAEWGYGLDVREGKTILQMGLWGGRGIPKSEAVRLAARALRALTTTCSADSHPTS